MFFWLALCIGLAVIFTVVATAPDGEEVLVIFPFLITLFVCGGMLISGYAHTEVTDRVKQTTVLDSVTYEGEVDDVDVYRITNGGNTRLFEGNRVVIRNVDNPTSRVTCSEPNNDLNPWGNRVCREFLVLPSPNFGG